MNNTHNASCGFLKMNLAKYFQPFQWKTTNKHFFFFFFASDEPERERKSKLEKARGKKGGEERKAKDALFV